MWPFRMIDLNLLSLPGNFLQHSGDHGNRDRGFLRIGIESKPLVIRLEHINFAAHLLELFRTRR